MLFETKEQGMKVALLIDDFFLDQAVCKVKAYLGIEDFSIKPYSLKKEQKDWIVITQVYGKDMVYSLRFYIDEKNAFSIFQHKFKKAPSTTIKALDLLKECSNLMVGHLEGLFKQAGISTKISVPLLASYALDVTFEHPSLFKHKKTFQLGLENLSLLLKHELAINSKELLDQLANFDIKKASDLKQKSQEDDAVEFL